MPKSAKHIEFIKMIAKGRTQSDAYKVSFGKKNVSQGYAEKEGCVLAKKYTIEIQQAKENDAALVEAAHSSEVSKNALKEVLTVCEVDAQLSKLIKGEEFEVKRMNGAGKVWKAKITPEAGDILKGIQLYYNRFGSNAPTKVSQTDNDGNNISPNITINQFMGESLHIREDEK